ncbi:hypothetical protein F4861DRAFT_182806 [Xylaria intraflava]|nr:hypothetical protein F4861DRAFT_182806 [Xylaria intraflava]
MSPAISKMEIFIRFPSTMTWIWLHMLVRAVSGQRQPGAPVKEKRGKSQSAASSTEELALLWIAIPASLIFSLVFGGFRPSLILMILMGLCRELDAGSTNPLLRSGVDAIGITCVGWGAITTLIGDISAEGTHTLRRWISLVAIMMATTDRIKGLVRHCTKGHVRCSRRSCTFRIASPRLFYEWAVKSGLYFWHSGNNPQAVHNKFGMLRFHPALPSFRSQPPSLPPRPNLLAGSSK